MNEPLDASTKTIELAGKRIGQDHPPFIVAEMSANHGGDLVRAKEIIRAAHAAGADAVKIQTYTPDTMTLNIDKPAFKIDNGLWKGRTLYDLYQEAHLPWDWHAPLFDFAASLGIPLFSAPFDETAVDLLASLQAPAYKIASFELVDLPLIAKAAQQGKPMILSTGMANASEIAEAVTCAQTNGCKDIILLHCVSGYPAPASDYHLRTLADMSKRFNVPVGLSDHTLDNATAIAAVALGACLIEKHFTLDRSQGGPDEGFSLEPKELALLCRDAKTAWSSLGAASYERATSEEGNVQFRRSLYFVTDLSQGATITEDSVRRIRPGFGLPPREWDNVIGKRVNRNVTVGDPVSRDVIETN